MKALISPVAIFAAMFIFTSLDVPSENSGHLIINIDNVKKSEGIIWIGIYDSTNYMIKEKAIIEGLDVQSTGMLTIDIPNLSFGTYAIALFHDINGNGELDQNFVGCPYGAFCFFSNSKIKVAPPQV